eukprot:6213138-Pleurochrysis_carterae.AAC.2
MFRPITTDPNFRRRSQRGDAMAGATPAGRGKEPVRQSNPGALAPSERQHAVFKAEQLALRLLSAGKLAEGGELLLKVLHGRRALCGPEHADTLGECACVNKILALVP